MIYLFIVLYWLIGFALFVCALWDQFRVQITIMDLIALPVVPFFWPLFLLFMALDGGWLDTPVIRFRRNEEESK